ncbi:amidohydrolase family protein [Rhodalgimonas zhirmunskyi]|uniref:Amidohydrolase family protein n=1 Tax=Rhodalgimonas zhirmunskyi TaxID=2964767 RepID=A0AAJ1X5X6_9RHOB|nr:amidohydrolase family protein [Rhodoalgimonas zhirmunskyi]MDQ2094941.1 amidohydrolase family protein [Rhodoalgimonas zhirmunskyi]
MTYDLLIRNGRVIDPETRFDQVCDLAITDGTIAAIGTDLGPAKDEIDATGLVVSPGFIDIHAHGQSVAADRMQAFDGVTTTLELEVGTLPVGEWYDDQAKKQRVLHYGTAAAWGFARRAAFGGFTPDGTRNPTEHMAASNDLRWSTDTANAEQTEAVVSLTRQALEEGAIGIGMPNGYLPGAGLKELSLICDLAAEFDRPTYTHIAFVANLDPKSSVDSYIRLIGLAGATGAHMHICHLNSTSLQDIDRAVELIAKAQEQGLPVTTEAYPYGTGSTVVGAGFFSDPDFPQRTGNTYNDVQLVKNQHRFIDRDDLLSAAHEDPSDLVLWHYLDVDANEDHRRMLDVSVTYPGGSIASDAMPWVRPDGSIYDGDDWPLPSEVSAHPRSSGTFTRFLREYVRERAVIPLVEALAKCTIYPASVIERCTPQIARKGRLREGFDADITIFDPATITDRATFTDMNKPSEGVIHLIVGGTPVITEGKLDTSAAPGQPIRCPVSSIAT